MNKESDHLIKIFIADDHAVVRQGLKHIISQNPGMTVVGEAQNGTEVLEKMHGLEVDVVLMDIEMPEKTGLEILPQLKTRFPDLPVIILSIFQEEQYGIRLMNSGAAAYLSKTCPPEQLVEAIKKVAGGGKYITAALTESIVMNWGQNPETPLHETLSTREYQIFYMIAFGKKAKDIAADLSISVNTVNTHRTNILKKMNLSSNAEITRYAFQNKLVR